MIDTADAITWRGRDVDAGTIERHISEFWKHLPVGSDDAAAVRTRMFNFVIYAENQERLDRVLRLTQLSKRHPSRAVVLVPDRSHVDPAVDAEVSLHCRPGPSGTLTYCYEQIVLAIHGRAADHLSSVVAPLLMSELPTYLWWPGQPPLGSRLFNSLLSMSDQLILDSAEFDSPATGISEITRICSDRYGINDFHWARLTPWREIVAQFFDGAALLPYLQGIRSVTVEFGSGPGVTGAVTSGLLLIIGWLGCLLGWNSETTLDPIVKGDTKISVLQDDRLILIDLQLRDHGPKSMQRLMSIEILSQPPGSPPGRFRVQRDDSLYHVNVSTQIDGQTEITRLIPLGIKTDDQLLAEELELAGQDLLYKRVIHEASGLAGRESQVPL
jgi:glucose-6-phosphate dehydrogenase assembly protein OpcA